MKALLLILVATTLTACVAVRVPHFHHRLPHVVLPR